jgi:hypothetical protein
MRQVRLTALILCFFTLTGCEILKEGIGPYETKHQAKARVTNILQGIKDGGTGKSMQTALCRWYNDSVYINESSTASFASDMFDRWRVDGGIGKGIAAFEVTEATIEEGAPVEAVLVGGTIDTRPFSVRVPKGQTITWVTKPKKASRWD